MENYECLVHGTEVPIRARIARDVACVSRNVQQDARVPPLHMRAWENKASSRATNEAIR